MSTAILSGLFVILGAVIASLTSFLTGLLTDRRKRKFEIQNSIRNKREQLYLDLIRALINVRGKNAMASNEKIDIMDLIEFNKAHIGEIALYASNKIRADMKLLVENCSIHSVCGLEVDLLKIIDLFIEHMRDEIVPKEI